MSQPSDPFAPEADPREQQTTLPEWKRALVSLFCCVILGLMAALFGFAGEGLFRWLSILPGLLSLLLLYGTIHSLLGIGIPRTTLRIPTENFRVGQTTRIRLIQQGPVSLYSLRINLVCEVTPLRQGKAQTSQYPVQQNVFDEQRVDIGHNTREWDVDVTIPADALPTREGGQQRVRWYLEVWGDREWGTNFQRPFDIRVLG